MVAGTLRAGERDARVLIAAEGSTNTRAGATENVFFGAFSPSRPNGHGLAHDPHMKELTVVPPAGPGLRPIGHARQCFFTDELNAAREWRADLEGDRAPGGYKRCIAPRGSRTHRDRRRLGLAPELG